MAETLRDTTTAFRECIDEFNDLGMSSSMGSGSVLFSPEKRQLDLLEVCCPPDSALATMVEKMGGISARVTEKNMNGQWFDPGH